MNIRFIVIGKTQEKYLQEALDIYAKRLTHYIGFEVVVLPDVKNAKNLPTAELKEREAEMLLKEIDKSDKAVLLDEKGAEFTSVEFSKYFERQMNASVRSLAFVVGGAFGFSPRVKERVKEKISLSRMTFSHQMIRLLALEQIYRAFTIIKNEPYHNE